MRLGTDTGFTCVCGKPGAYAQSGECRSCYRKRKRKGLPAPVVQGVAKKAPASYKPHKDGRMSNPAKHLVNEAGIAFMLDDHYLIDIAKAAGELKHQMEELMSKYGFTFEEAIFYLDANYKERERMRNAKRKNQENG